MKTKIDIISGFLGAGKTTLIKKLLEENFYDDKIVIIENEFGEIGIDGTLIKKSGLEIKEINSGCICCTLMGDFEKSIKEVLEKFVPNRIIIEPSGVGKLSEIIKACKTDNLKEITLVNMIITVVDVERFDLYISNFGQFFEDQIKNAKTILLSRTQRSNQENIELVVKSIQKLNNKANIVTTPWENISGEKIVTLAEGISVKNQLVSLSDIKGVSHIHRKDYKTNKHNATDAFQSWSIETPKVFIESELKNILERLKNDEEFGTILRGKGIIQTENSQWRQFDYIPEEIQIKETFPDYTGRLCIIGTNLNRENLCNLFNLMI
ncbi:GTP-binding protein [Tissierella sp. MSJ-40]|uniref:GTP-binding protein n=1 Tax=Tissierella simiarum TaxID=2841534 RepID=A0ABS6E7R3_9FIRM|nr:GTP-binding protein [Tissierella simiarum]MBU5438591.1 GTP-binding protein [Tissierella simiarum]